MVFSLSNIIIMTPGTVPDKVPILITCILSSLLEYLLKPYFTAENLPHFSSNEAISATKAVWSEVGHTLHKRGVLEQ